MKDKAAVDPAVVALLHSVRAHILEESERLGLNQVDLERKAGVNQSNVSKLLDLTRPMTEIRARVLFALITKGLEVRLSTFFAQIDGTASGISLAKEDGPQPKPKAADVDQGLPPLPSSAQILDALLYWAGKQAAQREDSGEHATPRGHVASPRAEAPTNRPAPRKIRRRNPAREKARRRPGK